MNLIEKHFNLNGPTAIEIDRNIVYVSSSFGRDELKSYSSYEKLEIDEILSKYSGKLEVIFSTDVLLEEEEMNFKAHLSDFKEETIMSLYHEVIRANINDIVEIVKEEEDSILFQASYDEAKQLLLVTVGIIDDIRVVLLEIRGGEANEK